MKKLLSFPLFIIALLVSIPVMSQEIDEQKYHVKDPNTRIVKFYFFSPLTGSTAFGYEHMLRPGISIDGQLGIIGLGQVEAADNSRGIYLQAGPKFYLGQDFYLDGMKDTHPLRGKYFRPELAVSFFNKVFHGTWNQSEFNANVYSGAILLNFGQQWVMANRFSVDLHIGAGYAVTNKIQHPSSTGLWNNERYYYANRKFAYTSFEPALPFAITTGFNIGYAF